MNNSTDRPARSPVLSIILAIMLGGLGVQMLHPAFVVGLPAPPWGALGIGLPLVTVRGRTHSLSTCASLTRLCLC